MTFIRSYYLYIYYWHVMKEVEKNGGKPIFLAGFIPMMFYHMTLFIMMLWWLAELLVPNMTGEFYTWLLHIAGRTDSHKGTVNIAFAILSWLIAGALSIYLCGYKYAFESIPKKLHKHKFLRKFSWWKLFLPSGCFLAITFFIQFII